MAVSFQLVIDCADPEPLARFWAAASASTRCLRVGVLDTQGLDHYAVAMKDPDGNEFDIN
jgi:hypothetical protein